MRHYGQRDVAKLDVKAEVCVDCAEGAVFWEHRHDPLHASSGRELIKLQLSASASTVHAVWRQQVRWRLHIPAVCRPDANHGTCRRRRSQGRRPRGPSHQHGDPGWSADLWWDRRRRWQPSTATLWRMNATTWTDKLTIFYILPYDAARTLCRPIHNDNQSVCRFLTLSYTVFKRLKYHPAFLTAYIYWSSR